jgi:hypothetical protein
MNFRLGSAAASFGYTASEDDGGTINDLSIAERLNLIIDHGNVVDAH